MQSVKIQAHVGADGLLKLEVPTGLANLNLEVMVIIQPVSDPATTSASNPEELGWPPGFFEQVYGSLRDDPIERPPQPELEERDDLL